MTIDSRALWQGIRTVPDFPNSGVAFFDISPLLRDQFGALLDALVASLPAAVIDRTDTIVGIEARGFILASALAARLNKGLVLARKPGKLPPPVLGESYALEYGTDRLELASNHPPLRVLIADDVLATGGTLRATQRLCEQAGHQVLGASVLIDIEALHERLPLPIWSVLQP